MHEESVSVCFTSITSQHGKQKAYKQGRRLRSLCTGVLAPGRGALQRAELLGQGVKVGGLPDHKGPMAARTLMYFRGTPRAVGCTILLKGASVEVLTAVKKVTRVG